MKNYDTASEAINDLAKRGYTSDFKLIADQECIVCNTTATQLSPEEFQIDETHRFEGETDPADEMIVHAISSTKYNLKGVIVNGYGTYADTSTFKIIALLKKHYKK